ncbi:helix-turn-helix domain-containing protein [Actinomadura scrupuli]|uniref:helix-turn-helix domain-containing protein n=1 Tax=Actinomadura scrupuli TaxID=559629 RepID=UPI003D97BF08
MPATPEKLSGTPEHRSHRVPAPSSEQAADREQSGPEGRRQAQHQAVNGMGERLRARRTEAGLSLRKLARDLGVSASFLSQVETGKTQPSVATLYLICSKLDLSIDELFAGQGGGREERPDDARPAASGDEAGHEAGQDPAVAGGRRRHGTWPAAAEHAPASTAGTAPAEPRDGRESASPVVTPQNRRRLVLDSGVVWEQLSTMHEAAIDFLFVRYDVGGSSTLDERLTRHSGVEYGYVIRGRLEITLGFETYLIGPGEAISFDSSTPHRLSNVGDEPVEAVWFVRGRNNLHQQGAV